MTTDIDASPSCVEKNNTLTTFGEQPLPTESRELTAPIRFDDDGSIESLRTRIASSVVTDPGKNFTTFESPFEIPGSCLPSGKQFFQVPLVYCDHTASHRPVKAIEDYIESVCLPLYANTHTSTSVSGNQTSAFVTEARQIVAEETNAKITGKASLDVVLFAGNGATAAVELLIDCLGLHFSHSKPPEERPVVFVGPYEHHSNLLPWRETGCEIVLVPECPDKHVVDLTALEQLLQEYSKEPKRTLFGSFSAASNVTGTVSDVDAISAILHQYGALAFFDYATGASGLPINMNPAAGKYASPATVAKDAIFFSPHKLMGGVGTPGVLIVKKNLVSQTNAPRRSGGGTVFYVTDEHHRFSSNRMERYEGGTPNVVGVCRVGLTVLMKRQIDREYKERWSKSAAAVPPTIQEYDFQTYQRVAKTLKEHAPNLVLLANDEGSGPKLPIFSFLIRFGKRFLHCNYVSAILNDVFGVQTRAGCNCAGPYSHRLLGLTYAKSDGELNSFSADEIEHILLNYKEGDALLRPGYTRLSLPFKGLCSDEVDYVVKALLWVAKNGWALMCHYRCNHRTGHWRHSSRNAKPLGKDKRWLTHFDFVNASSLVGEESSTSDLSSFLDQTLSNADLLLEASKRDPRSIAQASKMNDADEVLGTDPRLEELRWFVYPKEVASVLSQGKFDGLDQEPLVGALNPFRQQLKVDPLAKKRKSEIDDIAVEPKERGVSEPMQVFFRDGEHSGEAAVGEIRVGIDDGELSEHCEVFDPNNGEWLLFETFQRGPKKLKAEVTSSLTIDRKRGLKKPLRDNTTWGQGTAFTTHSSPAIVGTPPALMIVDGEEDDDDEGDQEFPDLDTSVVTGKTASLESKEQNLSAGRGTSPEDSEEIREEGSRNNEVTTEEPLHAPGSPSLKKKKTKHMKPPAKMMRLINQAVVQWEMLEDGDRLLLGLSGGKDSMSLLHALLELQRKLPTKFEIEVCTIDPMTPSFDPSSLIPYVESLGLKYHYIRDDIVARASSGGKDGQVVSSLCAYCARMKRGNLYACARRNNCNKLVLAQHLDDCAETFMMTVMHNGFLRTMKAHYRVNAGDISVIRPMVYCRESLMTDFAKSTNLPVINENCPACFEEPKERARVKKLLSREETLFPNFYDNIRRSLIPLMHDDSTAILRSYLEETVARSKKENYVKKAWEKKAAARAHAQGKDAGDSSTVPLALPAADPEQTVNVSLRDASDEALVKELARRKAEKYRLVGAMKRVNNKDDDPLGIPDATGQVCTLNGGDGSISCHDLME